MHTGHQEGAGYLTNLPRISDIDNSDPDCPACRGEGWVCDSHPITPWKDGDGCCGDCGRPCHCNPLSKAITNNKQPVEGT